AVAAAREQRALAILREVGDRLAAVGIANDGADRKAQHDIVCAAPVAIGPAPVFTALRAEDARVAIVDERIEILVRLGMDAAAAAAIPAIRSAAGNESLAAKRCRSIAALAGDDLDACLVEEFHLSEMKKPRELAGLFRVPKSLQAFT